ERRAGLPYNIVGGFSFYERMEVRDIIAYLKLALNPNDSIALQRVINSPPRGIGKQTLEELDRRAKNYGRSLWETILLVTEKPEGLSIRAVTALKSFQKIVLSLGRLASAGSADIPAEGTATADASPPVGAQRESLDDMRVDSESPVSDVVKAAILNSGYESALKSEKTD